MTQKQCQWCDKCGPRYEEGTPPEERGQPHDDGSACVCRHVSADNRMDALRVGGRYFDGTSWVCPWCGTAPRATAEEMTEMDKHDPHPVRCECCGESDANVCYSEPAECGHLWSHFVCEVCHTRCTSDPASGNPVHLDPSAAAVTAAANHLEKNPEWDQGCMVRLLTGRLDEDFSRKWEQSPEQKRLDELGLVAAYAARDAVDGDRIGGYMDMCAAYVECIFPVDWLEKYIYSNDCLGLRLMDTTPRKLWEYLHQMGCPHVL